MHQIASDQTSKNSENSTVQEGAVYDGLQITLRPAPFFKRFFAYALDLAVLGTAMYGIIVFLAVLTGFSFGLAKPALSGTKKLWKPLLIALLCIVLIVLLTAYHAYFIIFESKRGHTPGKRIFGLKVSSVNGNRLTLGQCIMRDMFRYIDCMLFFPGLLSIILTKRGQRLGDLAANTVVTHSVHQERAANFLYVKQDDYLLFSEAMLSTPVPPKVCEEYLKFAYPYFFQNRKPKELGPIEVWKETALKFVQPKNQEPLDTTSLLLFFAELCFQTLQKPKQTSSQEHSPKDNRI